MIIEELFSKIGFKVDKRGLDKAERSLKSFQDTAKAALGVIGGAFAAGALKSFVEGQIAAADEIGKTSAKLGIGTDALQEYRFASERSGVSAKTFDLALQRMTRRAAEAAQGTGEAKDALRELGVELRNTDGSLKGPEELLPAVADGLRNTTSQSDRLRLSFKLFDSEGAALVNLLGQGSEEVDKLRERFRLLGGVIGEDSIKQFEAAQDAITDWDVATGALQTRLVARFLPTITRWGVGLAEVAAGFGDVIENSNLLQATLIVLGAIAAAVVAPLIAPFIPAALAIGAVVLVVDELITTFEGGDTLIRRFIDSIFGVGTTTQVVEQLTAAWVAFKDFVSAEVVPLVQGFGQLAIEAFGSFTAWLKDVGIPAVVGFFESVSQWFTDTFVSAEVFFGGMVAGFLAVAEQAERVFNWLTGIGTWLGENASRVVETLGSIVDTVGNIGGDLFRFFGGERQTQEVASDPGVRRQAQVDASRQRANAAGDAQANNIRNDTVVNLIGANGQPGQIRQQAEQVRRAVLDAQKRANRDAAAQLSRQG